MHRFIQSLFPFFPFRTLEDFSCKKTQCFFPQTVFTVLSLNSLAFGRLWRLLCNKIFYFTMENISQTSSPENQVRILWHQSKWWILHWYTINFRRKYNPKLTWIRRIRHIQKKLLTIFLRHWVSSEGGKKKQFDK